MRWSKAFVLIPLVSVLCGAAKETVGPPEGPVEGWERKGEILRFAGKDLYGHIDGGAELYHEFGFEELLVQTYGRGEDEISLEIYRMDCPRAALGIYLHQTRSETPVEGIGARNSGNRYQVSAVKGSLFVQTNSFSGAERLIPAMGILVHATLSGVAERQPEDPWSLLPKEGRVPGSERLIRGPFALQPIFTFGEEDILQLGGEVFGVVGDYEERQGIRHTRILVEYPEELAARTAYDYLIENLDPHSEVQERAEDHFLFKDYRDRYGFVRLDGAVLDLRVNLLEPPRGE